MRSLAHAITALALTLVACATAQDPEIDDNGGGTANTPAVGGGGSGAGATSACIMGILWFIPNTHDAVFWLSTAASSSVASRPLTTPRNHKRLTAHQHAL